MFWSAAADSEVFNNNVTLLILLELGGLRRLSITITVLAEINSTLL